MLDEKYPDEFEIPSQFKHLYKQVGDEYVLLSADEMRTFKDVNALQNALRSERDMHRNLKRKYASLDGLDIDDVMLKVDRHDELKTIAESKSSDQVDALVKAKLNSALAPIERKAQKLEEERDLLSQQLLQLQTKDRQRSIGDSIREAASKAKIRESALDDVMMIGQILFEQTEQGQVLTKDGVGVVAGLSPEAWLADSKSSKPHWWGDSIGGGARSGVPAWNGSNPFSKKEWNMTRQMEVHREDPAKAEQLAKAAGTTVGGGIPSA